MNPLSLELTTAVHDWQQDARRKMDYTGIYADRIKTEAALCNDAVRVFSSAFIESNTMHEIIPPTGLRCTHPQKWNQGMQILQRMDEVVFHVISRNRADVITKLLQLEN